MNSTEKTPASVVYIDDDEKLAHYTAQYLESHNLRVTHASGPRDGIATILRERPEAILLDLTVPDANGFEICRTIRNFVGTPIIMLTKCNDEVDCVMALEAGADDYLARPFSPRELVARIKARIRRARGAVCPMVEKEFKTGALTITPSTRTVNYGQEELVLTTYEFDLLCALCRRAGQVITREQLMEFVKGSAEEAFDRSVDVHISHLRKKLREDPKSPRIIKTVRGVGYMLTERWDVAQGFA